MDYAGDELSKLPVGPKENGALLRAASWDLWIGLLGCYTMNYWCRSRILFV
jgi:hypothetical protein